MRSNFAAQPSRLREGSLSSRLSSAAVLAQDALHSESLRSAHRTQSRSSNGFRFIRLGGLESGLNIEPVDTSRRNGLPASVGTATSNAANLGNLSGNTQFKWSDAVGGSSKNRFFRFDLSRSSQIKLELGQLSGNADLRLLNIDSKELGRSLRANLSSESINQRLSAGTYYIQVSTDGNTSVNYSLNLNGKGSTADGGDAMRTALDAGNLNQMKRTYRNRISSFDAVDMYRVNITETARVNFTLNRLSNDADILLLNAAGDEIAESSRHGRTNESIRQQLSAGTYYVKVNAFDEGLTRYSLGMSTEVVASSGNGSGGDFANGSGSNSGNGSSNSSVTGSLSGAETIASPIFSRSDQVSATDRDDLFQFNLTQAGIFSADLTGAANQTGMRLIRDANNNGTIDAGEVLSTKTNLSASVRRYLDRGTYFLQVAGDGAQTINYSLKTNFNAAGNSESVVRINRTSKTSANGLVELQVALTRNGAIVDQLPAISGVGSRQAFRTGELSKSGSMEPLPEGYWSLGVVEWASGTKGDYTRSWADPNDGLGPVWITMNPLFTTERTGIGFHLDNNAPVGMPGTAGCIGILNKTDLAKLVSWFDDSKAPKLAIVDWNLGTVEV